MQTSNDQLISRARASEPLPETLLKDHLLALFPKMGYDAVLGDSQASDPSDVIPLFFTKDAILLFPPSTDNPNKSLLKGIVANVSRVCEGNKEALNNKDLLLFPIYQEWNVAFYPRNFWALGVYVVAEHQFYLLDPTGPNRAYVYSYNLKYLNKDLTKALAFTNVPVKSLIPYCINIQPLNDKVSSGYWIAYFIEQLASGMSLQDIRNLSTQTPLVQVDAVKVNLSTLHQIIENEQESSDTPRPSVYTQLDISPVIIQHEKQDYAHPSQNDVEAGLSYARSLLHSGVPRQNSQSEGRQSPPISGDRFKFDFYLKLIFAGTLTSIVALLCLAPATPVISATVSTGLLAAGVTLFVAGALGRCGVFGRTAQPNSESPFILTEGLTR